VIPRDPKCVFVASSLGLAEVVVVWLGEQGVAAQVMNPLTLGGLDGLTPWSPSGVAAAGIEVWVNDPADAPRAAQLLAEQAAAQAAKAPDAQEAGELEVTCEECSRVTAFPASRRGKVENCPECGAYLDVVPEGEVDESGDWEEAEGEGDGGAEYGAFQPWGLRDSSYPRRPPPGILTAWRPSTDPPL
jgi:hypothetical protein